MAAAIGVLLCLFVAAAVGVYQSVIHGHPAMDIQQMTIHRITQDGNAETAAISPDGKLVAYTRRDKDRLSLVVKQLATGGEVTVAREYRYISFPQFRRDDGYVYFVGQQDRDVALYAVPALGGFPRRLITGLVGGTFDFSDDGSQVAFSLIQPRTNSEDVMVANADGSNPRLVYSVASGQTLLQGLACSKQRHFLALSIEENSGRLGHILKVVQTETADTIFDSGQTRLR
jgi:WD40-like Beta Propeller Repeat